MEPVRHRDRGRVGERAGWHGHAHVVDLSLVLHVRGAEGREVAAAVRDGTRTAELFDGVTLEPREDLAHRISLERTDHRRGDLVHDEHLRRRDRERGELRRIGRHDHGLDADITGVGADVKRTGAADRKESEISRVQPSADGHAADEIGHAGIEDVDDPDRRLFQAEGQRLGDALADGLLREAPVELPRSTEEVIRVDAAEDDVRVRHGRIGAATRVRRGPGLGARALWTDFQEAGAVDPRDAAAAAADGDDIDHREAEVVLVEQRLARVLRLPIDDEPDVEARPADIGREHVRVTEHLPEVSRADHPARRT